MTKPKILPYINRFTGDVKTLPRKEGKLLNEDWARAKMVTNQEGNRVFRFELDAEVTGKDGKVHKGTAIVDLSENDEPIEGEIVDGKPGTE
jgi:hypothetical protein